jgi:hypothetical protein
MARNVLIEEVRRGKAPARRWWSLAFLALGALVLALAVARAAEADGNPPAITLGAVTVNGNTAVVSGSVGDDPTAEADVQVNGHNVGVDASGDFTAVVDLNGESYVELTASSSGGEITTIRIPVAVLRNGGGQGVLDELQQAGVSVDVPPDGFQILDDQMPTVTGSVLNKDKLASLTVNGQDVLSLAGPGGGFSILPAQSQQVTLVSTGHNGVSETSAFRTSSVTSTITTKAGTSVSALGAQGVVIAKIRFDKRHLLSQRRLGIIVTVKDRRGYLIRGAALRLKGMPLRYFSNGASRSGFTNRVGLKRFAYTLQKRAFTDRLPRRLTLVVRAGTPRAAAKKVAKMQLPLVAST